MNVRLLRHRWLQHSYLFLILIVATVLRFLLVLRGGQFIFPDESLYFRSFKVVSASGSEQVGKALWEWIITYDRHIGFLFLGLGPATIQNKLIALRGGSFEQTLWLPAMIFSLASVAAIVLVYGIALRAGAQRREATLAALLLAGSTVFFVWSRHLLPYDTSMALALWALWLGMVRSNSAKRSYAVGVILGLAFLTYYGYWMLVVAVAVVHIWWVYPSFENVLKRSIGVAAGALSWLVFMSILNADVSSRTFFLHRLEGFSKSIEQGVFAEGWSVPWAFLWHAEHLLLLLWGAGVFLAVGLIIRGCDKARARVLTWLGLVGVLYLSLVVSSTLLHRFVVYGRLVHPLLPFFCLLTAFALAEMASRVALSRQMKRIGGGLAILSFVIVVAMNYSTPFAQKWPRDIINRVFSEYGNVSRTLTIVGPETGNVPLIDRLLHIPPPPEKPTRWVLLNVDYPYPVITSQPPPDGKVIFKIDNPFSYYPYQYEGWTPEMRQILRSTDISMQLIDTKAGDQ